MGKLTIVDVARLAGVSTATVSRTMRAPHMVTPSTRERVWAAIHESGYVYNATAGDFSRRRSSVIGVLIFSTTTKVNDSVSALQEVAAEHDFSLMVCSSGYSAEQERKYLR